MDENENLECIWGSLPLNSERGKATLAKIKEYLSLSAELTSAEVFALQDRIPSLLESIRENTVPLRSNVRLPGSRPNWKRDLGLQRLESVSDERWVINFEFAYAWDTLSWDDLGDHNEHLLGPKPKRIEKKKNSVPTKQMQPDIKLEATFSGTPRAIPHQPKIPSKLRTSSVTGDTYSVVEDSPTSPDKEQSIGGCLRLSLPPSGKDGASKSLDASPARLNTHHGDSLPRPGAHKQNVSRLRAELEAFALSIICRLLSIPASRSEQEILLMLNCKRKYFGWDKKRRLMDVLRDGYIPKQITDDGSVVVTPIRGQDQTHSQRMLGYAIEAVDWVRVDSEPMQINTRRRSGADNVKDEAPAIESSDSESIKLVAQQRLLSRAEIRLLMMPRFSKFRAKEPSPLRASLTRRDS
jgi:hypothetical protein